jgi:hypothetical protein
VCRGEHLFLLSSVFIRGKLISTMRRRTFLRQAAFAVTGIGSLPPGLLLAGQTESLTNAPRLANVEASQRANWLARWEKNILAGSRNRYCDKETGEELGWLVSPFLNGFYYGYLATRDAKWIERLVDWTDACIRRAVREPDGFRGWPKGDGGGNDSTEYQADSLLGEAMMLRPVVLAAAAVLQNPELRAKWGEAAKNYLKLAEEVFHKWDSRDCWREVKKGGLWVVPAFGIDLKTGRWSAGYDQRKTTGFSNPDNKENHIARWLLAMHDATRQSIYRDRAAKWFQLMKSRLKLRQDGKYLVWNYWEPAGPWDFKPDGSPKHWVGVHPNGGYYEIDVEAIVDAFDHQIVFDQADIQRLIATNRDYMWNQQLIGAKFQRIDGDEPDSRWKNSPGLLWSALVPFDATLKKIFVANHDPADWGGLALTPWFLSLRSEN